MENLKATSSQKNVLKPLSSQEFQEMLNLWFEEKGVLRELRLQLRIKLVNLLKDTIIGKDMSKGDSQGLGLFNQAVNLIVAEYLIHSKCYYSLSVFNLEASVTSLLPKSIAPNEDLQDRDLWNLHFDKQNISHILELIGLAKNTEYSDKLINMYFNKEKNQSLLWCLITLICQLPIINAEISETMLTSYLRRVSIDSCDETYFLEKFEELLKYIDLSNGHAKKISQSVHTFYEKKSEQEKNELMALINKQNNEIVETNKKLIELRKSKSTLQRHLIKTNRYYKKTKAHLSNLQQEENILKRNISHQNINIDVPNIKQYDSMECNVRPNILVLDQSKAPEKVICQSKHCSDICKENMNRVDDLLSENDILKKENKKQKESLKKLFLIYKDVLGKFNNCQNKLNFLNSKIDKGLHEDFLNNFLHGGNIDVTAPHEENIDDSDVSSSLTEEILQEARIKLQKLENETKDIEDKFKHMHLT